MTGAKRQQIRGFILACTNRTEKECFERLLFGAGRAYGPVIIRIRKGDLLFLHNLQTDSIYGVFEAISDGGFNIDKWAWSGKFPYQVRAKALGKAVRILHAEKVLNKFGLKKRKPLTGPKLVEFLQRFISNPVLFATRSDYEGNESIAPILRKLQKIMDTHSETGLEEEIPPIELTTLWDFPRQSYGFNVKGDNQYPGVTPALVVYNLIWKYTDVGDLVVDPMCGSGTTIDVCKEEMRRVIGYDIAPSRKDIHKNDATKNIPLEENSADLVFIDSPYGDNIRYSSHPQNIGRISCESEQFYDALEEVMKHSKKILKEGKVLAWLIGDQWVGGKFTPVALKTYERLSRHFEPVDIVCVARKGQASNTSIWYNRARRLNFFLRGFKYLIIVRKPLPERVSTIRKRKIEWNHYSRNRAT